MVHIEYILRGQHSSSLCFSLMRLGASELLGEFIESYIFQGSTVGYLDSVISRVGPRNIWVFLTDTCVDSYIQGHLEAPRLQSTSSYSSSL